MNPNDDSAADQVIDPLYENYTQIANKTLLKCEAEFKQDQKFSDQFLLNLYHVFGGIFERALELFENARVTHIYALNVSDRESEKHKDKARYLIQIKGHSNQLYTLFPDINYCDCPYFRCHVLYDKNSITCKHILAAWLASLDRKKLVEKKIMQRDIQNYKFVAKLRSVKSILQLLKAVNFKEFATCVASENGLKVTVEDEKCMQASAYIPAHVFQEFNLKEDVIFKINLTVLVECLSMSWTSKSSLATSAAFQILYEDHGSPVSILIEEDGIITECHLKDRDATELINFHLSPEDVVNKVVLQTELLKDVLADIDTSSDILQLVLSPSPPYFRLSTEGLAGICHVDIPHDGELIGNFDCTTTATTGYKLTHIKPAMKALTCANKVSLRTDKWGLLCFQYMLKTEEGHTCYIEYYVSPIINMDD